MTEDQMRTYLMEWAIHYCRNDFEDGIPAGVEMFVEQGIQYFMKQTGITSESLGDYSVSLSMEIPKALTNLLTPYRRLGII